MKFLILFVALFAVALTAPVDDAQILRQVSEVEPESYSYSFETSDGTKKEEKGELKNVGKDEEAIVVRGSVSWVAPDGKTYTLKYIADENGFQPEGDHLPVVPEVKY